VFPGGGGDCGGQRLGARVWVSVDEDTGGGALPRAKDLRHLELSRTAQPETR
jgi:hypothetical protein